MAYTDEPLDDDERWATRQANARLHLAMIREHFVSAAIAAGMGMPDEHQAAGDRGYELMTQIPPKDLAVMVAEAMWPSVEAQAIEQLKELRDFHYVDQRYGLLPIPPRRNRAVEVDGA